MTTGAGSTARAVRLRAGILVGGASSRMGGFPKGLLPARGQDRLTLVERLIKILEGLGVPTVLLGTHSAYGALGIPMLEDSPSGVGPMGGLHALLQSLERSESSDGSVGLGLLLSCDLPFVSGRLLEELIRRASNPPVLTAVSRAGRYEPMLAIYPSALVGEVGRRIGRGQTSLNQMLREHGANSWELSDELAADADDWDAPGDLPDELRAMLSRYHAQGLQRRG